MPETKYGIPSVIEARLLANIVGWQKAKEMVYFAKFYDGEQMEKWGLVDESCEDVEELEKKVSENGRARGRVRTGDDEIAEKAYQTVGGERSGHGSRGGY
jgi:enoyl-CoA hydratase/carnithine racemase